MNYPNNSLAATVRDIAATFPGFKQSRSWIQYEEAFSVARALLVTPAPELSGLAVSGKRAEEIIRKHATEVAAHRGLLEAAEQAAQYADRSIGMEARYAVAEVAGLITEAFDDALARFRASQDAPETLSGYESDQAVATYQARQRAANDLDYLGAFRVQLGRAIGELGTMNNHGTWCYMEAPSEAVEKDEPERLQAWGNVIGSIADIVQMPAVARFALLERFDIPLSVPAIGGVEDRHDAWLACRGRASTGPHLTALGEEQRRASLGLPVAGLVA